MLAFYSKRTLNSSIKKILEETKIKSKPLCLRNNFWWVEEVNPMDSQRAVEIVGTVHGILEPWPVVAGEGYPGSRARWGPKALSSFLVPRTDVFNGIRETRRKVALPLIVLPLVKKQQQTNGLMFLLCFITPHCSQSPHFQCVCNV